MLAYVPAHRHIIKQMAEDTEHVLSDNERNFRDHLNRFVVAEDTTLTAIGKVVCARWAIWPDQLVGHGKAGDAARTHLGYFSPLTLRPSTLGFVVQGRRTAWYLAGELTDHTPHNVAEAFGSRSPAYVASFMTNGLERMKSTYPEHRNLEQHLAELAIMAQVEFDATEF